MIVGAAARVLVVEVVEAALGDDLDGADRLAVEDGDRDLLAVDEALDQHVVVEAQRVLDRELQLQLVARDPGPERRTLAAGLHDDRKAEGAVQLQQILAAVGLDQVARRGGQVVQAEDLLRLRLVHRERRGEHARAGVGNAEQLQHPLDAAVLAVAAVQGQKRDVDARLPEHQVDVAVDEQGPRVVAPVGQCREDGLARCEATHRALPRGRPSERRSCAEPSSFHG